MILPSRVVYFPLTNLPILLSQAAELAEHTARIALLEEAKRRKEEEAVTWQHRVRALRHEPIWE